MEPRGARTLRVVTATGPFSTRPRHRSLAVLFMLIERLKDPIGIYRRGRDKGRMLPDGLQYVSSWVDLGFDRCWQLMETDDERLLDAWIARWSDLIDFEIVPVVSSKEASERIAPRL